jgi:uncharacterized protein YndB with AHSA1/START domain
MKWVLVVLGGLVGICVLAVLVLFAMGFRSGARENRALVEIACSREEVFAWISEPERQKQWVSWLVEVQDASPGVTGAGRNEVWVMDDPNMKQKISIASEYTGWDPPNRLEMNIHMDGFFDGTQVYTLTDAGGKTRLEQFAETRYLHPFYALLEPLVTPAAQKKMVADLAQLKAKAEAE